VSQSWTFGQKLALGFAAVVACAVLIGGIASYALRAVVADKDVVINVNAQNLIEARRLAEAAATKSSESRGYLLTREARFLDGIRAARADFSSTLQRIRGQVFTAEGRAHVQALERTEADHQRALDDVLKQFAAGGLAPEATERLFEQDVVPKRDLLERELREFVAQEERLLADGKAAASEKAAAAIVLVVVVAVAATLLAIAVALVLGRTLSRQVGSAV
jgi:CHASE3 domain sensor protein